MQDKRAKEKCIADHLRKAWERKRHRPAREILATEEGREAVLNFRRHDRQTLLHWAARQGKARATEDIIQSTGRTLIGEGDKEGWTPLHLACEGGDLPTVRALLETREGRAALKAATLKGTVPLHSASAWGHAKVVRAIRETDEGRSSIRSKDNLMRSTPLHMACYWGHADIVRLFVQTKEGRDVVREKDALCRTGLHWAALKGHADVAREILEAGEGRAAAWERDSLGRTPRDLAEEGGHADVVGVLDDFAEEEEDNCPDMDAVNCGVCYSKFSLKDPFRKPVVTCGNGHTFCQGCVARVGPRCPGCREPRLSPPIANLALSGVMEELQACASN